MRSGFAGEFHRRFYSCLFANFVVQMPSAWEKRLAEEDLGDQRQWRHCFQFTAGELMERQALGSKKRE